jgi:glycosyltransferase involved in cell wall biosynthesis
VLLLIPHLGGGGAEQVMAVLARGLSREKYELHLVLITQSETGQSETGQSETGLKTMPPWVHVHALGADRVRNGAFSLLRLVRRLKPDVILSGMFHVSFLALLLRPLFPRKTRILVRQNGTVSAALAFGGLPRFSRLLYRLLYRHADRVICQTPAMARDLIAELAIGENRLVVLPNPVDVDEIRTAIDKNLWTGPGPHLLAVGRLVREKGFDLLLRTLTTVRREIPSADLVIVGAGAEEAQLKAQCRELALDSAVRFAGYLNRPSTYFPGASVFVLSSRHEGLPNALLEAAAGGLPLVASPASQGLVDLLRSRPGVWMAQEVTADALACCLLQAFKSLLPGQRFDHSFIDEFRIDRAIVAYEDLLDAVLPNAQPDAKLAAKIQILDASMTDGRTPDLRMMERQL